MSTALSFAFHTSSLKTLAIFGLTMVVIASLVALQLFVYRDCLGEPSPSAAICGACNSTADLVELRTPVRGITGAIFYRMDCCHTLRRGSCGCVCRDICDGEFSVPRVCLGGVGAGGSPREDLGTDAADDSSSIVRDAGVLCHCDGSVAQVSIVGLWARVLCLVCLSATRSLWRAFVKMA